MNLLTLGDCKETIARVLGVCTTDDRVTEMLNEAQERLLNRPGKPVGSFMRYQCCVNNACLTWPRQVRSIESWAVCDDPGYVRSGWWEFSLNGPGLPDEDSAIGLQLLDRGTNCAFDDITAGEVDRQIQVTTDVAEASGTYLWLYGLDENSNPIRTQIAGTWYDGERLDLSACPQQTTNFFTVLTRTKKDATKGMVRLYEYNTTTAAVVRALAYYEPSETNPIYRRSFIPNLANMGTCDGATGDCTTKKVTIMARLQHVPVSADNDSLVIGNLPALKDMVMAIKAAEENRLQDAEVFEQRAIRELDGELAAYIGDGETGGLRVEDREVWGAAVENVI